MAENKGEKNSEIQNRIRKFIEYLGIDVKSFEINVGLSNGAVSKIGESPRSSTIDKITSKYPELNKSWVLLGLGNMIGSKALDTKDEEIKIMRAQIIELEKKILQLNEDKVALYKELLDTKNRLLDKSLSPDRDIVDDKL